MAVRIRLRGADKLRALSRLMGSPDVVIAKASEIGQEETLNLISEGFKRGRDPYGAAWDAPNDLQITGRLRAYTKGPKGARGWQVHSTDEKAAWHHSPQPRDRWGGKALPVRMQVPTTAMGLPAAWARRMRLALEEAIESMYRRVLR